MIATKTRALYLMVLFIGLITYKTEFNAQAGTGGSYVIYNKQSKKVLDIGKNVIPSWTKVDDDDASVTYTAGWGVWHSNPGYNVSEHASTIKGAKATFTFTGVQARYYGYLRSNLDIAEIRIDGNFITKINCFDGNKFDALLYETPILPYGTHTLEVLSTGERAPTNEIIVDAFAYAQSNAITILSVIQTQYTGATSQKWSVEDQGNSYFQLINEYNGKAISIHKNADPNITVLELLSPTTDTTQHWKKAQTVNNYSSLISRLTSKNIDIPNASVEDSAMAIYAASSSLANQQWGLWDASMLIPDLKLNIKSIYKITDSNGLALDNNCSANNCTFFYLKADNASKAQQWTLMVSNTAQYYTLTNTQSNKNIDNGNSAADGNKILQWNADPGNANQQWNITYCGYYYTIANKNGKNLDSRNAPAGEIVQYTPSNAISQQWKIDSIGVKIQNDWEDETIFAINKEPGHSTYVPFASIAELKGSPSWNEPWKMPNSSKY